MEDLRIGGIDHETASFSAISNILEDEGGRIFVFDQGPLRIAVFDSLGSHMFDLGGRGDGPGEFTSFDQAGRKGDTLWVQDPASGRITMFQGGRVLSGTISYRITHEPDGSIVRVIPGSLLGDGTILGRSSISSTLIAGGASRLPFFVTDRAGKVKNEVVEVDFSNDVLLWGDRGQSIGRQLFSDSPLMSVARDGESVWLLDRSVDDTRSTAALMSLTRLAPDGSVIHEAGLPYDPIPLEDDAFNAAIQEEVVDPLGEAGYPPDRTAALVEAHETRGYRPHHLPPASAMVPARDGGVWIRREDSQDGEVEWWVVNDQAQLKARILLPSDLTVHHASDTRIWGVQLGTFDEPYVVRFKVVDEAIDEPG